MILIQNVYHMLAYAFRVLNENGYKSIATERFENTAELCAAILIQGMKSQIKRGLNKSYISVFENTSLIKGKINVAESYKTGIYLKKQLHCTYDEFTEDSYLNRIIKSTMILLLHFDISKQRKKEIKKLLVYLNGVQEINLNTADWNVRYNRNNQTYRMMISVCYLVVKGLLQTQADGTTKLMDFLDDQRMHLLYEKFILAYYTREFKQIKVEASHIDWQVDDDFDELLPIMKTDIMLTHDDKTLIIDAKYYKHSLVKQFDKLSAYSSNLYQIFTYVKNKETELEKKAKVHKKVAGMLLYAQTEEGEFEKNYMMSGNPICIKTLNLNQNFDKIKEHLNQIAEKYLGAGIIE